MNGPYPVRSFLARHFTRPIEPAELESMRARAWIEQNVVVMLVDEITDDWLRAGVVNWASKRYGRRFKK